MTNHDHPTVWLAEDGTAWISTGRAYPEGFYVSSVTGADYEFTETNHSCERQHGPLRECRVVPVDVLRRIATLADEWGLYSKPSAIDTERDTGEKNAYESCARDLREALAILTGDNDD